ncbi:MAG: DUF2269 domain-containing protein [Gammaproteobacteria bacterium]|nr:DUF2269 domain-containing protein [Gammaproteobacteria bacterium]
MIRLLHIVSSALMFGVGIGAFWFMVTAARSGSPAAIAVTTRNAVRAEWFIATPVALLQPTTGYLLMLQLGYPLQSSWFVAVVALYISAGMCWVYLVKTELKLRDMTAGFSAETGLPAGFAPLFQRWTRLALGSFAGVLAIFGLMVFRPGL